MVVGRLCTVFWGPRLPRPTNHGMIVKDNVRVGDVGAPQSLYRYAANANLYHLIEAHYPPHTVRVVGGA